MPYFITKQFSLFSSYQLNKKEEEKLNKFLLFLENSGIGELIHQECYKDHSKGPRCLVIQLPSKFTKSNWKKSTISWVEVTMK